MKHYLHSVLILLLLPAFAQSASADVKKSRSGICHDITSPSYHRTKHFTEYSSLEACLQSGGRREQRGLWNGCHLNHHFVASTLFAITE